MSNRVKNKRGVSLIELMIGLALIIATGAAFIGFFRQVVSANNGLSLNARADMRLQNEAEKIRYTAATAFDDMHKVTDEDRSDGDRSIKVLASISEIDPITQARRVQLVASWKVGAGPDKTRTLTFFVRKDRAKVAGAKLKVHVVGQPSSIPAPSIKISAPGMEIPLVEGVTNSAGDCELSGVLVSGDGIYVTIDGEPTRHYFQDGSSYSFSKIFHTAETLPSATLDMGTIDMKRPAEIRGRVVEDGTPGSPGTTGAPGVKVKIISRTLIVGASVSEEVFSGSDGTFISPPLVPGTYWIYNMGSPLYAATAKGDDANENVGEEDWYTPPYPWEDPDVQIELDPTHQALPLTKFFVTRRMSDVTFTVRTTAYSLNVDTFVAQAPLPGMQFYLYPYTDTAWISDDTEIYLGASKANKRVPRTALGGNFTTNSDGQLSYLHFGPWTLDTRYDLDTQAMSYYVNPYYNVDSRHYETPRPATPVLVNLPGAPKQRMTAGHVAPPAAVDVQFLNESDLSNLTLHFNHLVSGVVQPYAGNKVVFPGGFIYHDGSINKSWNSQDGWLSAPNATFNFPGNGGFPPSAAQVSNIRACEVWSSIINRLETGMFRGYEKVKVGDHVVFREADPSTVNMTFTSETYLTEWWPYSYLWSENLNIVNGLFKSAEHNVQLAGSNCQTIQPLIHSHENLDIDILFDGTGTERPRNLGLKPIAASGWYFPNPSNMPQGLNYLTNPDVCGTDPGCFQSTFTVFRVQTINRVYGRVLNSKGEPILGASVTLTRSGGYGTHSPDVTDATFVETPGFETLSYTTKNDACTFEGVSCPGSGPYQFVFSNVAFTEMGYPYDVDKRVMNLKLTVSADGYDTWTEVMEGYEGLDEWPKDFHLQQSPPAASAGGL